MDERRQREPGPAEMEKGVHSERRGLRGPMRSGEVMIVKDMEMSTPRHAPLARNTAIVRSISQGSTRSFFGVATRYRSRPEESGGYERDTVVLHSHGATGDVSEQRRCAREDRSIDRPLPVS